MILLLQSLTRKSKINKVLNYNIWAKACQKDNKASFLPVGKKAGIFSIRVDNIHPLTPETIINTTLVTPDVMLYTVTYTER